MKHHIIPLIFLIVDITAHQILGRNLITILATYFVFQCFNEPDNYKIYISIGFLLIEDFIITGQIGLITIPIIITIFLGRILRNSFKGNLTIPAQFLFLGLFLMLDATLKTIFFGQIILVQSTLSKIMINMVLMSLILLGTWGSRFLALSKRGKSGLQTGRMPYKV